MPIQDWMFNTWTDLARVLTVGAAAYVGLIVILRLSGKRTLSKMNAFDFVVTVALGSIMASTLLASDVSLAEGLTAVTTLVVLQFIITWLSVRSATVRSLVRAEPTMVLFNGQFLSDAMRQQRVTKEEVRSAVRGAGMDALDQVEAVVLETEGTFTVIPKGKTESDSVYGDLIIPPKEASAPSKL